MSICETCVLYGFPASVAFIVKTIYLLGPVSDMEVLWIFESHTEPAILSDPSTWVSYTERWSASLWISCYGTDMWRYRSIIQLCKYICYTVWGGIWHDDVIKWKHFARYWPFVRVIHRSLPRTKPVTRSFDVLFDLRRHRAHYDVIVIDTAIGVVWFG